jgi:hypothetical protein
MKINRFVFQSVTYSALPFGLALLAVCAQSGAEPTLAAGEQGLVGLYRLDNVLLGPGQLVVVHSGAMMFEGVGDTLEQAAAKGLLNSNQVALLRSADCTLRIRPEHSFGVTNLPAADFSRSISFEGKWGMKIYHVFDAYGYRISMNGGPKGDLVLLRFIGADKPSQPILEMIYNEGKRGQVTFRFVRIDPPIDTRPKYPPHRSGQFQRP